MMAIVYNNTIDKRKTKESKTMTRRTKENLMYTLALIIIVVILGIAGHIETHYTRKDCKVVETSGKAVYVVDSTGNEWCYVADEEVPTVGTKVDLKMFTAYTDNTIKDDEIVNVIVKK
jgi:hypothetical protein